ncbi:MAG: hypothetical protein ACR2O2_09100 [Ruegeria sp.]
MKGKLVLGLLAAIFLAACGGASSPSDLRAEGWTLVARNDLGEEYYLRRADEPNLVYWQTIRTRNSEIVLKREYDCPRDRYRDVKAPTDEISRRRLPYDKGWKSISKQFSDSVPRYISEMICRGQIVPDSFA